MVDLTVLTSYDTLSHNTFQFEWRLQVDWSYKVRKRKGQYQIKQTRKKARQDAFRGFLYSFKLGKTTLKYSISLFTLLFKCFTVLLLIYSTEVIFHTIIMCHNITIICLIFSYALVVLLVPLLPINNLNFSTYCLFMWCIISIHTLSLFTSNLTISFTTSFPIYFLQAEDTAVERKMLKKNLLESLICMLDRTFAGIVLTSYKNLFMSHIMFIWMYVHVND